MQRQAYTSETYERMVGTVPGIIYEYVLYPDNSSRFVYLSKRCREIFEVEAQDMVRDINVFINMIHPDDLERFHDIDRQANKEGKHFSIELRITTPKGITKWIQMTSRPNPVPHGSVHPAIWSGVALDITDRKTMDRFVQSKDDEQLIQFQKLESIGTLVGGIIHDINNMLVAIIGNAELALEKMSETGTVRNEDRNVRQILKASLGVRSLVKQLLDFSRKKEEQKEPVKIGSVIEEAIDLFKNTLPATIQVEYVTTIQSDIVLGYPSQIQQVIMNLITNAVHAMQGSDGLLKIDVSQSMIGKEELSDQGRTLRPGRYIKLSISDTGVGMTPDIQKQVFNLFFTTKEPGEGTGLGLTIVSRIVHQHGGTIHIHSNAGEGCAFHILFPALDLPE